MITKSHNHNHFWIKNGHLYESYNTLRGLRYRFLIYVKGMPNEENCTEECIDYINKEYF